MDSRRDHEGEGEVTTTILMGTPPTRNQLIMSPSACRRKATLLKQIIGLGLIRLNKVTSPIANVYIFIN